MPATLQLDGTTLEGGGQLLRLAVGLSALTQQPIRITNIRGNRTGGGGLKLQHLAGVQWLSEACGAPTQGAEKKSRTLHFWSKSHDAASLKIVKKGRWSSMARKIDIGSPGAVGLVLQAILPYVIFSGAWNCDEVLHIEIKGGTNVSNSPSIDYLQRVLVPMLEKIGIKGLDLKCRTRGWSTGRAEIGSVSVSLKPFQKGEMLPGFLLKERGHVTKVEAVAIGPRASEKIFHRQIKRALESSGLGEIPLEVDFEFSGHEKRLYLLLVAETSTGMRLGRDHLYQERISSLDSAVTTVVDRAAHDLDTDLDHGGCVDEYMQDQLIVFQALSDGESQVTGNERLSLHAETAQWVVKELLGVEFGRSNFCTGVQWTVGIPRKRKETLDDVDDMLRELNVSNGNEELQMAG